MALNELWNISKQFTNLAYTTNNEEKISVFNSIIEWLYQNANDRTLLENAIIYSGDCGKTPLHFILLVEAPSYGLVDGLLRILPDVAKVMNNNGDFPLHLAAKYNSSYEDIKAILKTFLDAIMKRNYRGQLPLHCSCHIQEPTRIRSMLL
jgi:ankyrin repeat protein